jgi:diadenosine tetraphosphate (Ap4A) HIT family hydrolase
MIEGPSTEDCVFCVRREQPEILFETRSLYVVPDKFPLLPGHVLVISKAHHRCHAETPAEAEEELEGAAERARVFLRAAYGVPVLVWENGVCGQTVHHAHLHLLPLAAEGCPAELEEHPEVWAVGGWEEVRTHFAQHGGYHYLELAGDRRLLRGNSSAVRAVQRWLAAVTGLQLGKAGWLKQTSESDVLECARRWRDWLRDAEPRS